MEVLVSILVVSVKCVIMCWVKFNLLIWFFEYNIYIYIYYIFIYYIIYIINT